MTTMAEAHEHDYQILEANRELSAAIAAFLKARPDGDRLKSPVGEYLETIDARLAEETARIVRAWD